VNCIEGLGCLWRFYPTLTITMMSPNLPSHSSRPRALDCPSTAAALAMQTAASLFHSGDEMSRERRVCGRECYIPDVASTSQMHTDLPSTQILTPPTNISVSDRPSSLNVVQKQRRPLSASADTTPHERLASARAALLRHKKQLAASGSREACTRPPARLWLYRGLFPEHSLPPGFQPELAAICVSSCTSPSFMFENYFSNDLEWQIPDTPPLGTPREYLGAAQ
jgi:hypothetical protein